MRAVCRLLKTGRVSALAAAGLLAMVPGSASAAYPGENGKIAFARSGDIWVANPDGSDATNLTPGTPQFQDNPVFSPDGTKIAYTIASSLSVMDADGANQQPLATGVWRTPAWSPSGDRIAISNSLPTGDVQGIRVVNATTGATVDTLNPPPPAQSGEESYYDDPTWSPTSQNKLAVSYSPGDNGEIDLVEPGDDLGERRRADRSDERSRDSGTEPGLLAGRQHDRL